MNAVHSGIDGEEKVVCKQTVFTVVKVHPSRECASAPSASGLAGPRSMWLGSGGAEGGTCVCVCERACVPLECSRSVSFNVQSMSICSRRFTLRNRVISSGCSQREHTGEDDTVRLTVTSSNAHCLTSAEANTAQGVDYRTLYVCVCVCVNCLLLVSDWWN